MTERLDAEFYKPIFLSIDEKLKSNGEYYLLSDLISNLQLGYTGPTEKYYSEEGVFYLSSKNVINGFVEITDATDKISFDAHKNDLAKTSVITGDVLITRTGNVGKSAVVSFELGEANTAAHVISLRVNEKSDGYFLSSFLNTYHGMLQSERHQRGTIIQGLSVYDIPQFIVPKFNTATQKYIGNKVRQAERLLESTKETQNEFNDICLSYFDKINKCEFPSFWRSSDLISEVRLDSFFYHPDYIALDAAMTSGDSEKLGEVCYQIKSNWDKKKEKFAYYEISNLNIGNGSVEFDIVETIEAPSRAKTGVKKGDVLVSTVRPNRRNVGFIIDDTHGLPMVATSGFCVLRFTSLENAAFYHAWLRTIDATTQLMRWNSGSAYPAIDDDVPLNIFVPTFEKRFKESWGEKLLDSHYGLVCSKQLTTAAKLLVEGLIEGLVTEAELIAAQQGLEAGDTEADAAILRRLKTDGLDGKGQPLFGDVERVYELLKSASQ